MKQDKKICIDIAGGLKRNLRFYPTPGSAKFESLSAVEQQKAIDYFKRDNERITRLIEKLRMRPR